MMYGASSPAGTGRRPKGRAETAGFRWQPEMWPMAKAMVSTVKPKASEHQQPDAQVRKRSGEHRAAATAKNQPESAEKFSAVLVHGSPPGVEPTMTFL